MKLAIANVYTGCTSTSDILELMANPYPNPRSVAPTTPPIAPS